MARRGCDGIGLRFEWPSNDTIKLIYQMGSPHALLAAIRFRAWPCIGRVGRQRIELLASQVFEERRTEGLKQSTWLTFPTRRSEPPRKRGSQNLTNWLKDHCK